MRLLPRLRKATSTAAETPPPINQAMTDQGMSLSGDVFGPGTPLAPWAGYSRRPRAFDYPVGVNISTRPREAYGRPSYATIKAITNAYDIARICINHKIDSLRSMELMFLPADGVNDDVSDAITAARAALEFPDRELPFDAWLAKWLEGMWRYDAACLYRRRDRAGRVIGLEVVDGTTILPWIDEHGRRPAPPAPAYGQLIKGVPMEWLTSDDLIYTPFRPQTDSPFGLAPIESIILAANTDLRFQMHFLNYFTAGSLPGGFLRAPKDAVTPDQVAEWQDFWDALMIGDQEALRQIKVVPNDMIFDAVQEAAFDETFPLHLIRRTCAAFGVVPQDLGIVVDVNRANGETQVDVQFRVNDRPPTRFAQGILTRYVQNDLGLPVKVEFDDGQEKEDRLTEAQAWKIYTDSGFASVDEAREKLLGLPTDPSRPIPRGIIHPRLGFIPFASVEAIAGPTDPDTLAPSSAQPLPTSPFDGTPGLVPDKLPGGTQFTRAPINPDDPARPELEHPIPGTDIVGGQQPAPMTKSDMTAGVTSDTGLQGLDLPSADNDEDDEPRPVGPVQDIEPDGMVTKELQTFERFAKTRTRSGKWRDFTFTHVDNIAAHRLNDQARARIRKDAGQLIAAGVAVQADDTGRVLMLQRALTDGDPAGGCWEFPGGHIEDGESPFDAACREWQEETGCLLPAVAGAGAYATFRSWTASNGVYCGLVVPVESEASIPIGDRGQCTNPDDPDGDQVEAIAWWDPAQLVGNTAIRPELAADLSVVLPLLGVGAVTKAGDGASPKARSWREPSTKLPIHAFDLAIVDHYTPAITSGLQQAFSDGALRQAIDAARQVLVKQVSDDNVARRTAAKRVLAATRITPDALKTAVQNVYGDAYLAGTHVAAGQTGGRVVAALEQVAATVDWSAWHPGYAAGANAAADGGLATLLTQADVTVRGISGTLLDQLGNTIADGVGRGLSTDQIAANLAGIITEPSRAQIIAITETSRAVTAASLDTYSQDGLDQVDWLVSDPCDVCADNEAGSPYDLDEVPDLPAHPSCRCALAPHSS